MFAVIFRAEIKQLDEQYSSTSKRLRELAMAKYDCIDFIAVTEGNQEIAISYWKSEEDIKRWQQNSEHLQAQKMGKEKWYQSYQVQIAELK